MKRWYANLAELYLIKIESSENSLHPWSGKTAKEAQKVFAQFYPAVHEWLMQFRNKLIQRDDQGKYFWELRSCKYWHEFEKPKIVYPNICKRNEFAWDENGYYFNQKTFIIPEASKYLLGIMNSHVITWLFDKLLAKLQNGYFEPSAIFMRDFPIPVTNDTQQIEILVDEILRAKPFGNNADISDLESQIDKIVYQLYRLTQEEIEVVEELK